MRLRMRLSLYAPSISLFRGSDRPGEDGPAGVSLDVVAAVGRLRGGEGGLVQAGGPGAKNCRPGPYADLSECNFADADLPPELTFSSGGKLTATHTQAGSYEFTVEAVNEVGIADDTGTVTIWPPRGSGGVGSRPGTGQRPADPDERSGLGMAGGLLFAPEMTQWECGRL
jgi:hypothetical protein